MRASVLEGVCSDTSSHLLGLLFFLPSFDMIAHSSFWNTLLLASMLPHSCFFFFPFLSEGLPFRSKFHGDFPGPLFLFTEHECILSQAFKYYLMKVKVKSLSHVWPFATPRTVAHQASVHGILQAWILEWVAISFSRGSSQPRDRTQVSRIAGRHFNLWATREAHYLMTSKFVIVTHMS